ncbi:MAG: energy transducer TonB [Gallionella sp.]|nr:energy transducer TonB [Gallionella sp.]
MQKLDGYTRLAIILSLSLLVHLAIIYGVPWSPVGEKNIARSANMQQGQHRLTVTLTPTPRAAAPQAIEKTDVMEVADVDTETNMAGDSGLSTTDTLISTALDSRYFTLAELDQHPAIARDISDNPPELLEYSQGGEIVLRLWIDKTGNVVNVDTVSSNLPPVFVDSARAGFLQAVFLPGRKNGNTVATVMDIVVSYEPAAVNRTPKSIHGQPR